MLFVIAFLLAGQTARADLTIYEKDDWRVAFGGFAETDLILDSTKSFVESIGARPVERPGSPAGENRRLQFSIRSTRFGFDVQAPRAGEWRAHGRIELDFLGFDPEPGSSNTEAGFFNNPTARMRAAYLEALNGGWRFVAGQYWTLFAWKPFFLPSTLSSVPVGAAPYEWRAQLMAQRTFSFGEGDAIVAALSVERPVQRDSGVPTLDAGVRFVLGDRRAAVGRAGLETQTAALSFGLSGTARAIVEGPDNIHHLGEAVALNAFIPILASEDIRDTGNTLSLQGGVTAGQGYGEHFPAFSGNLAAGSPYLDPGLGGYDGTGAFQLARLQTWDLQLQYFLPMEWATFLTVGVAQLRSSNVASLGPAATGKVTYDRLDSFYFNVMHELTPRIRAGLELDQQLAGYADGILARDFRGMASIYFVF